MIKIQKENKGTNWYVFLIIGLLIGAVLGYWASNKGLFKSDVVGRKTITNPDSKEACEFYCDNIYEVQGPLDAAGKVQNRECKNWCTGRYG